MGELFSRLSEQTSRLVRSEIELAKAEISGSAKRAGVSVGSFAVAGVMAAFAAVFFFIALAEFITWLGLQRWISYLIVWFLLVLVAGLAALIGRRFIKKIEKPERTLETLHDLPEVLHREQPGQRHRAVPEITNGRVQRQGTESYTV